MNIRVCIRVCGLYPVSCFGFGYPRDITSNVRVVLSLDSKPPRMSDPVIYFFFLSVAVAHAHIVRQRRFASLAEDGIARLQAHTHTYAS